MDSASRQPQRGNGVTNIIRDIRFIQIFGQTVFIILVAFAFAGVINQIISALASRNLTPNFLFLQNRAGFAIGGAQGYTPDDSYWAAFMVGLRNTLTVVAAGLVGATVLGIMGGVLLLSGNWLVRSVTRLIVDILRNTPLLVQIFVWYFVVVLALPPLQQSLQFPHDGLVALPLRFAIYLIVALLVWLYWRRLTPEQRKWRVILIPILIGAAMAVEIGFLRFYQPLDASRNLFAAGMTKSALLWGYLALSAVLICSSLLVGGRVLRVTLWGLLIGQVLGGLLFLFGLVPSAAAIVDLKPAFFLSNRGLVYPEMHATARFGEWALFVALGIAVAIVLWFYLGRATRQTGKPHRRRYYVLSIFLFALIGWVIATVQPLPATVPVTERDTVGSGATLSPDEQFQYATTPLEVVLPERAGLRFKTGVTLDPRYIALLLALAIYTASFIAEVVRAGIMAVPHGQVEAARALGLSESQVTWLIVLPQALRVIIPPLGNQYLNLAKNSSLALAIAYSDIYAVMNTVINQSGQAVTGIIIIMAAYLIISLTIAGVMNWVNRRFQLVTR